VKLKGKNFCRKMKIAIVIVVIGKWLAELYQNFFRASHEQYARRYGYDLIIVKESMDTKNRDIRTFYFQKTLVFSESWSEKYDHILYIDCDIFINPNALSVEYLVRKLEEKKSLDEFPIGMVLGNCGSTGLILASPKLHGKLLRNLYNMYVDEVINSIAPVKTVRNIFEKYTGEIVELDSRYNAIWTGKDSSEENLEKFFVENLFIHFADHTDWKLAKILEKYILPKNFKRFPEEFIISGKDVVLIPCVLNSDESRMKDLMKTLESVREKIPGALFYIMENTAIHIDQIKLLTKDPNTTVIFMGDSPYMKAISPFGVEYSELAMLKLMFSLMSRDVEMVYKFSPGCLLNFDIKEISTEKCVFIPNTHAFFTVPGKYIELMLREILVNIDYYMTYKNCSFIEALKKNAPKEIQEDVENVDI
jgi:hypothetical protein